MDCIEIGHFQWQISKVESPSRFCVNQDGNHSINLLSHFAESIDSALVPRLLP